MMLVACDGLRQHLEAFHDEELPLETHLAVRAHLDSCAGCAFEHAALVRLREDLQAARSRAALVPPEGWASDLLAQVQVERQLSWHTWLAHVFDDMHLVWPAIGATVAVLVCLVASAEVMHATSAQHPESLAGVIDYLASQGSNTNPARIDGFTMVPRRHASSDWPLAGGDAVLALSAVVTREGRIQSIEMLAAEQARALKVKPEVVLAMLEAASRAQFDPARAGGVPIAVSMVWLLAHTTVVANAADVEYLMRPMSPTPAVGFGPEASRRPVTKPVAQVPAFVSPDAVSS